MVSGQIQRGLAVDEPGGRDSTAGMCEVDGYSAEWPDKNAGSNARHAVTPLESMPVIWLVGE